MGVVEKVRRRQPETSAAPAPSYGVGGSDEASVSIVTKESGLTIVTKKSRHQNRPGGQNRSNFEKLRRQTEELVAARDRVRHTVEVEERKNKDIEPFVLHWLNSVDEIAETIGTFLNDECPAKTKGLQALLAKSRVHPLNKKATKLEQVVVELYAKRDFPRVSYSLPIQEVLSIPTKYYEAFDSRISILESIMDELKNADTDIILVHGMGGVGKTTLVREVLRKAIDDKYWFDDVVMVPGIRDLDLGTIQQILLEKLGMDGFGEETIAGKAHLLFERIRDKKILVVLDDVWEIIDLEAIGLHRMTNCKILLTSRTRGVLSGDMRTQKEFGLSALSEEESWSLFEKIAGDVVNQDPRVQSVATQIAKHCGGLPLAVVTIARCLKGKSAFNVWKDALNRLDRQNEPDRPDFSEGVFSTLELSYNYLADEELRQLFLLCGITASSTDSIVLGDLLKYGMGLGLFKSVDTVEEATIALHSLVRKLTGSCLLQDGHDDTLIRMHDLVRDVAIRIACRDHHVLLVASGAMLTEWPDKDFLEKCTMITLPSWNIPSFPSVPWKCPELKMFTLRGTDHDSLEIPIEFFEDMKVLKVLDLTNLCIRSLQSLRVLTNLRTLCLDQCVLEDIAMVGELRNLEVLSFLNSKFKQLPQEIAELIHLRLLDLTDCSELETIPPNVISSLTSLEDLRMRNSFNQWEAEQVIEERRNASLSELKYLSHLTALDIHIPDGDMLPANIFSSKLERYHIIIGDEWTWHNVDETCNTLKLKLTPSNDQLDQGLEVLLKKSDDWHLDLLAGVGDIVNQFGNEGSQLLKHLHVQNSSYAGSKEIILENQVGSVVQHFMNEKVVLPNLRSLSLYQCGGSRFLLSSSMARSLVQLKHLQISRCETVEEIVSTADGMSGSEPAGLVFPNLEILEVVECGRLKTLGLSTVSFMKLTTLEVIGCHELKYLTTYLVSKNSMQLRRMEVKNCKKLIVMVVSNRDHGAEIEIDFSGMLYLELSSLPSLQGFCSEHCIAKFPLLETIIVSDCPVELKISPDGLLRCESKPVRVITIEVEEEEADDDEDDNNLDALSATSVEMPPECVEQAEALQSQARNTEADPSEPQKRADKGKQKMYPEDAYEPQITENIAPEIQISEMIEDPYSEIRDEFPGIEEKAKDPEEKENDVQFGLSEFLVVVPQIEPNVAFQQREISQKEENLADPSNPITIPPEAVLPLTNTQQRLQTALELLRSPFSSSPQSPEVAAAKATLLELIKKPIDEVVDHVHDLESRFHSACTLLVKQQVLSAGVVQGLDALFVEICGSNQRCCTITSDLAALEDKPDEEASISNSMKSLVQICFQQEQRSHEHAERISMLRQELLLEEEAKAKLDQELENNLKQLDPLQDQLVAIRNNVTRSEALQVALISQKNKSGALWDSIRCIMNKHLHS